MLRVNRRLVLSLAAVGTAACTLGVATFFWEFVSNRIPWRPLLSPREHYLAVGKAFSRGFTAGFFLCFFLILFALVAGTWLETRRLARRAARID